MYYEINVTFQGRHLFATHPRSLRTEEAAKKLYETLLGHYFLKSAGYEITIVQYDESGHDVTSEVAGDKEDRFPERKPSSDQDD